MTLLQKALGHGSEVIDGLHKVQKFLSLSGTSTLWKSDKILRTLEIWIASDVRKTKMLYKFTRANCHLTAERMASIVR